jgi:hypothetical protein
LQIYEKYFNPKGNERFYFTSILFGEAKTLYLANIISTVFYIAPGAGTTIRFVDSEYEKCYAETVCRSGSDPEWLFISLQR